MTGDHHLSECLSMLARSIGLHARDGVPVEPEACTQISALLSSFARRAHALENDRVERDQLLEVARDIDPLGMEQLPRIDLMRLVVERTVRDAGGNVVIFPGGRRRHASSPTTGGAA